MSKATETVRTLIRQATEAHWNGDYAASASYYNSASRFAERNLHHPVLAGRFLHLSHLEKLLIVGTRDPRHLRQLIGNLEALAESGVDDRLTDQYEPLIQYFTTIALCGVRRAGDAHFAEARNLVQRTAKPSHYMSAVANALARLFLLANESLLPAERGRGLTELHSDLEGYLETLPMPREFASVLEEVSDCTESLASSNSGNHSVFFTRIRGLLVMDRCSPTVVLAAAACREHLLRAMKASAGDDPLGVTPVLADSRRNWAESREES
jgi:hypothetical protein